VQPHAPRVVGIGASAGGPAALDVVLGRAAGVAAGVRRDRPHLPAGFIASFRAYLRTPDPARVVLVEPGGSGVEDARRPGPLPPATTTWSPRRRARRRVVGAAVPRAPPVGRRRCSARSRARSAILAIGVI
jgi:hypothetical protein